MGIDLTKVPEEEFILIPERPYVAYVLITPAMAAEWLEKYNTHNRNWRGIAAYVNDMKEGRWIFNGDTITFGFDGAIQNGQHRLASIIQSGVPLEALVVTGLDPVAQATVDGGYMRLLKEQLALRGHTQSSYLAAIGTRLMNYELHGILDPRTARITSIPNRIEFIEANLDRITKAVGVAGHVSGTALRQYIAPTVVGASWAICLNLESGGPFKVEQFYIRKLIGTLDLTEGDPARALRQRLEGEVTRTGKALPSGDAIQYVALAWNHFVAGRSVARIQRPEGGFRLGAVRFK